MKFGAGRFGMRMMAWVKNRACIIMIWRSVDCSDLSKATNLLKWLLLRMNCDGRAHEHYQITL